MLAYNTLCQPYTTGGLNLLHAPCQQNILQNRGIANMLLPEHHSRLVTDLLLHHVSLAGPPDTPPIVTLLHPRLRQGLLIAPGRILPLIFKTIDGLRLPLNHDQVTVDQCLSLPLESFFCSLPVDHWINQKRHRRDQGNIFFVKDLHEHCLRPKVAHENLPFPGLLRRLLQNILERSVRLAPWALNLIATRPLPTTSLEWNQLVKWPHHPLETLRPSCLRPLLMPHHDTGLQYPAAIIYRFWKIDLDPATRTVWYKLLVKKVPLETYLQHIGFTSSSICRICNLSIEDATHFWVACPPKYETWCIVLRSFYPDLEFPIPLIMDTLSSLQPPSSILTPHHLLTILGTTSRRLWLSHWACKLDNKPFSPQTVANLAIKTSMQIIHH